MNPDTPPRRPGEPPASYPARPAVDSAELRRRLVASGAVRPAVSPREADEPREFTPAVEREIGRVELSSRRVVSFWHLEHQGAHSLDVRVTTTAGSTFNVKVPAGAFGELQRAIGVVAEAVRKERNRP